MMNITEKIVARDLRKSFRDAQGRESEALSALDMTIGAGEFVCLLGPSGCGKSTLLNLMAGFDTPSGGTLTIDGQPVARPNPRHIAIFQDYGLYPWRTVLGNILIGLEARGDGKKAARAKAEEVLAMVDLTAFAGHFPSQLSGGMKQRVALARALVVEPDILFMDEPFAALDAFTRQRLQEEILRIWLARRPTIVFVTHDIDEAVFLGTGIAIMSPHPGRIEQILPVDLPRPCDRNDENFLAVRREVYRRFARIQVAL